MINRNLIKKVKIGLSIFIFLYSWIVNAENDFFQKCKLSGGNYNGGCICHAGNYINPYIDSCSASEIQTYFDTQNYPLKNFDSFCSNTKGLEDLSAKVICSASSSLYACKGLIGGATGAALGGVAGVKAEEIMRKALIENLKTNKNIIVKTLSESLHNKWRGAPQKIDKVISDLENSIESESYTRSNNPIVSRNNQRREKIKILKKLKNAGETVAYSGSDFDFDRLKDPNIKKGYVIERAALNVSQFEIANTPYDQLSPKIQKEYQGAVSKIVNNVIDKLSTSTQKNNFAIKSLDWTRLFGTNIVDSVKELSEVSHMSGGFRENVIASFVENDLKPLFTGSGQLATISSRLALLGRAGNVAAKAILPIVGGTIGSVLSLWAVTTNSEFCEERDAQYMNVNEKCERNYSFNKNVINFLSLPPSKQLELLQNQKVCEYYKGLFVSEFSIPYGVKVNKTSKGECQATLMNSKNKEININVSLDQTGDGKIMVNRKLSSIPIDVKKYSIEDSVINTSSISPTKIDLVKDDTVKLIMTVRPIFSEIMNCCSLKDCKELSNTSFSKDSAEVRHESNVEAVKTNQ